MSEPRKLVQICFSPQTERYDRDGFLEEVSGGDLYGLDNLGHVWRYGRDPKTNELTWLRYVEGLVDGQEAE